MATDDRPALDTAETHETDVRRSKTTETDHGGAHLAAPGTALSFEHLQALFADGSRRNNDADIGDSEHDQPPKLPGLEAY